jgi:hypothetical protein
VTPRRASRAGSSAGRDADRTIYSQRTSQNGIVRVAIPTIFNIAMFWNAR